MFIVDIETLGLESTAVVLSAAILHFDPKDKNISFNDLLANAYTVKFDAKEQIQKYKRTVTKSTIDWWTNQPEVAKEYSLIPNTIHDHSMKDGMTSLYDYVNDRVGGRRETMWCRGSLDQLCLDSMSRMAQVKPITDYYNWRDIRTAIDIMYGTSRGYCKINDPSFAKSQVIKHIPKYDIVYDVMMLLKGVEVE